MVRPRMPYHLPASRLPALLGIAAFGLCSFGLGEATAGPNAGGVVLLHADPALAYTSDVDSYCGLIKIESCEQAVVMVPADLPEPIVFWVLAAFPEDSSPRVAGATFGIDYNPDVFVVVADGYCGDFALPENVWPQPRSGAAVAWVIPRTELLFDLWWFAGYATSGGSPTVFELIAHPRQGGNFVEDGPVGEMDAIAGYGTLGFGTQGDRVCPSPPVPSDQHSWGTLKSHFRVRGRPPVHAC